MYPTVPLFTLGYARFLSRINTSFTTTQVFVGCNCTLTYTVIFSARSCGSQQTEGNISYVQLCSYQQQGSICFMQLWYTGTTGRYLYTHLCSHQQHSKRLCTVYAAVILAHHRAIVSTHSSHQQQGSIFCTQLWSAAATGWYFKMPLCSQQQHSKLCCTAYAAVIPASLAAGQYFYRQLHSQSHQQQGSTFCMQLRLSEQFSG